MAGLLNLSSILLMILLHQASSQQCDVPGICIGQLLVSFESNDRYQCLSACSNLKDCTWFSSNEEDGFCGLFQTCDDVSTTECPLCISGEHSCPVLSCNLVGECQGTLLSEDNMTTEESCQSFCTSYTGCAFYTFHKNTGLCLLFEDCPELNNCQSCVSGQPGCYVEGDDQTTEQPSSTTDSSGNKGEFLFVVGPGSSSSGDISYRKTEIVSLTEDESIPECLDALSDHPDDLYVSAGGALPDAGYLPHTCGGYYNSEDKCWVYTPSDDAWTLASVIPRYIAEAASAFHPAWGIIMSGGYGCEDYPFYCDEVTVTEDAGQFEELEPMPYASDRHCVAAINSNLIFTTGLGDNEDESFMYDRDSKEWSSLPNMPTGRSQMGCGVVRDSSGKIEVVVAGGFDINIVSVDVVEIFNIEEKRWRTANNPFPTALVEPSVAQHDDSFYILGGYISIFQFEPFDTIYRYEASDESWQLMPNRMKYGRFGATAMMVNASLFPTCD